MFLMFSKINIFYGIFSPNLNIIWHLKSKIKNYYATLNQRLKNYLDGSRWPKKTGSDRIRIRIQIRNTDKKTMQVKLKDPADRCLDKTKIPEAPNHQFCGSGPIFSDLDPYPDQWIRFFKLWSGSGSYLGMFFMFKKILFWLHFLTKCKHFMTTKI